MAESIQKNQCTLVIRAGGIELNVPLMTSDATKDYVNAVYPYVLEMANTKDRETMVDIVRVSKHGKEYNHNASSKSKMFQTGSVHKFFDSGDIPSTLLYNMLYAAAHICVGEMHDIMDAVD